MLGVWTGPGFYFMQYIWSPCISQFRIVTNHLCNQLGTDDAQKFQEAEQIPDRLVPQLVSEHVFNGVREMYDHVQGLISVPHPLRSANMSRCVGCVICQLVASQEIEHRSKIHATLGNLRAIFAHVRRFWGMPRLSTHIHFVSYKCVPVWKWYAATSWWSWHRYIARCDKARGSWHVRWVDYWEEMLSRNA